MNITLFAKEFAQIELIVCLIFLSLYEITVKVFIDQFIQAPALLVLIISVLAFMEGRGLVGIREDLEKEYAFSLIQNCKFFPEAIEKHEVGYES